MPSIHRIVWNKLGVKHGDCLPLNGNPWRQSHRGMIAELYKELDYKVGAEVGVELGKFSRTICDTVPGVKLFCIDPWAAYNRNSQDREDNIYRNAMVRLNGCNIEVMRMTSLEASQKIDDNSLDFVYIDALHEFDNVMMDIILWSKKVRSGGIVSGHDYLIHYRFGVIEAVKAYTYANNINLWYVTTENCPSWFWVKP